MQQLNLKPTALLFAIAVISQGCATYDHRSCSGYTNSPDYQSAPDFKAIAQYFDRESVQPPAQLEDMQTECWYITAADSQKAANSSALEACENSLQEMGKFTDWNCQLVAEGLEITLAEKARLVEIARTSNQRFRSLPLDFYGREAMPKGAPQPESTRDRRN